MNEPLAAGSTPGSDAESNSNIGADGGASEFVGYAVEYGPDLADLRALANSGVLSGASGAVTIVRGLGSLRRGETGRGLFRLATGALLVAVAVAQRRAGDDGEQRDDQSVDQRDVAGSDTDLGDVSSGLDATDEGPATGGDPTEVADTGPDVEDVSSGLDTERSTDAVDDVDSTDVVDTGPDAEGVDPDPDPGSTSQERADRSDDTAHHDDEDDESR